MSRQWYGNLTNRVEENRMYVPTIEVGTGVTEYMWSDRLPYEVTKVIDQKHVYIRKYDTVKADDVPYSNNWNLVSNESYPEMLLVKRGKYWYIAVSITPERAKDIYEGNDVEAKIWACHNDFDLPAIIEAGKKVTRYHRKNVSFGVAEYYYDYEF